MSIIPDTFLSSMTEGNILQVLLVSILFGVALALVGDRGARVLDLLEDVSIAFFKLVGIVMKVARSVRSARWPSPSANTGSWR